MNPRRDQSGFVLLLTLVILALAAVVLVDVSRRSARRGAEASRALEEVRWRWAATTARHAVLPRADDVFQTLQPTDIEGGGPSAQASLTIHLNDDPVTLLLADEQAKVNLNASLINGSEADVTRYGAELMRGRQELGRLVLSIDPRATQSPPPGPPATTQPGERSPTASSAQNRPPVPGEGTRPLSSWAQVFPAAPAWAILGLPDPHGSAGPLADAAREAPSAPASRATLWGDGRIHLPRASDAAARQALSPLLSRGEIDTLVATARRQPDAGLDAWLQDLTTTERVAESLRRWVADESRCYALTIAMGPRVETAVLEWLQPPEAGDGDASAGVDAGSSDNGSVSEAGSLTDESMPRARYRRLVWRQP